MALGDSLRIYTNIAAFNALGALKSINRSYAKVQLQLSTGRRITEVSDDPAGYTISTRLDARTRGLKTALDNIGTAKNVLSTAEGGMQNISDILLTIKEKVTQAASDTLGSAERNSIKKEIDNLTDEIDDIVEETKFNNKKLIDGTYTGVSFQTGEKPGRRMRVSIRNAMESESLNISSSQVSNNVFTASTASTALSKVNTAIDTVSESLQEVGAVNSRLTFKENNVATSITNTEATISRIVDADMARAQLESVRYLILQDTSTSMLAQANLLSYSVLNLLRR